MWKRNISIIDRLKNIMVIFLRMFEFRAAAFARGTLKVKRKTLYFGI